MKRSLCVCAAGSSMRSPELRWVVCSVCSADLKGVQGGPLHVYAQLWFFFSIVVLTRMLLSGVCGGPAWGCLPSVRVRDRVAKTGFMPWAPRAGGPGHAPHWPQLWWCYFPGSRALQCVRPPHPLVILEVFRNLFVFFSKPTGCILQWFWNVSLDWIF